MLYCLVEALMDCFDETLLALSAICSILQNYCIFHTNGTVDHMMDTIIISRTITVGLFRVASVVNSVCTTSFVVCGNMPIWHH